MAEAESSILDTNDSTVFMHPDIPNGEVLVSEFEQQPLPQFADEVSFEVQADSVGIQYDDVVDDDDDTDNHIEVSEGNYPSLPPASGSKPYRLLCTKCPYGTNKKPRLESHHNLHVLGFGALPCPDCGIYVLEEKLRWHQSLNHNPAIITLPGKKWPTKDMRKGYRCSLCPYKTTRKTPYISHTKVHEEGSGAIPCPMCDILVLPDKMAQHCGQRHPAAFPRNKKSVIEEIQSITASKNEMKLEAEEEKICQPEICQSQPTFQIPTGQLLAIQSDQESSHLILVTFLS